jgi:hypothetical protein
MNNMSLCLKFCSLYWRHVIHLRTLCFRRARTDSNARVEPEALGNEFMVKAIELDIKLHKLAQGNYTASSPERA